MSQRRIPIDSLKVGMFVCGMDRSWLHTPFFTHRFLIQDETQIDKLKQSGIQHIDIDTARGADIGTEPTPAPQPDASPSVPSFRLLETPAMPISIEQLEDTAEPPVTLQSEVHGNKPLREMARSFHAARNFRQELLKRVDSLFDSISEASSIKNEDVQPVVQEIIAKAIENQAAFLALVRTRDFDPSLRDHLLSVSTLTAIAGKTLGRTPAQMEHLATGALLHDIGLLRLPHYMYRLPQTLKKGERSMYESHPKLGASLLQRSGGFPDEVIRIVLEHHEASGGDRRTQQSEDSRLVKVIDRYDEFLTAQTEASPVPPHQALSRLYQEAQGDNLDMALVSHLIRLIGVYPLYSLVALNTGEHGIVTAISPGKLHQPLLALFRGPNGELYSPPLVVDLAQQPSGAPVRSIQSTLEAEQEGINLDGILSQFVPESVEIGSTTKAG